MVFLTLNIYAQVVSYSEKNYNNQGNYFIIGQVKNHILVWKTELPNFSASYILVYNTAMSKIRRVKAKVLDSKWLGQIGFLNQVDSFQVFYECLDKKNIIVFKQATFDENGNWLHTKELFKSNETSNESKSGVFQFFKSNDNKSVAFLYAEAIDSLNTLNLKYIFVRDNIIHFSHQFLPFNSKNSNIGDIKLAGNNLFFSIMSIFGSHSSLNVFKINLRTDSVVNTLRQIDNGFLSENTLSTNIFRNNLLISANWIDSTKNTSGIFLWRLKNDLSDDQTDTIIEKNNDSNSVIYGVNNFEINAYQDKEKENLIIFSTQAIQSILSNQFLATHNSSHSYYGDDLTFYRNEPVGAGFYNPPQNPNGAIRGTAFNGAIERINNLAISQTPSPNLSNYSHGSTQLYEVKKNNDSTNNRNYLKENSDPENPRTFVVQLDNYNKILESKIFNNSIDKDAMSYLDKSKIINTANFLYLLFDQQLNDGKKTMAYLKIRKTNLDYSYNHLVIMNLNNNLMLSQSIQINDNTLIVPCSQNEFISFAKIVFN